MSGPYIPHAPSRKRTIDYGAYKALKAEGFNDEEISARFDVQKGEGEGLRGAANALLQGASFGFADEIGGMVGGDEVRDRMRGSYDRYRDDNPKTAMALEIGGSAVTGSGAAGALGKLGLKSLAKSAAGRVLTSTPVVAGGASGLAGFGAAEGDVGDRLPQALGSAAAGAVLGPAVGKALGYGADKAARYSVPVLEAAERVIPSLAPVTSKARALATKVTVPKRTPAEKAKERAARYAEKMFRNDGGNLSDELTGLAQLAPDDPSMLLNRGGRSVQTAAKVAQSVPSKATSMVPERVHAQLEAGPSRLTKDFESVIGGPVPNPQARIEQIANKAADRAKPHYDAIRDIELDEPDLHDLMKRPALREALGIAHTNILNRGKNIPEARAWNVVLDEAAGVGIPMPGEPYKIHTVGMLDDAKKVLDAEIESVNEAIASGMAKGKDKARIRGLQDARAALVERVDALTDGAYAKARGVAERGIKEREAFRAGTKYGRTSENTLRADQAGRSPEELDRVLEGAAVSMDETVGKTRDRMDLSRRLFGSPAERAKVDLITEHNPVARETLQKGFAREGKLRQDATAALLPGQSQTTPLKAALDDFTGEAGGETLGKAAQFLNSGWGTRAMMALAKARAKMAGLNEEAAAELGQLLTLNRNATAQDIDGYIQALTKQQQRQALARARARLAAPAVGLNADRSSR